MPMPTLTPDPGMFFKTFEGQKDGLRKWVSIQQQIMDECNQGADTINLDYLFLFKAIGRLMNYTFVPTELTEEVINDLTQNYGDREYTDGHKDFRKQRYNALRHLVELSKNYDMQNENKPKTM